MYSVVFHAHQKIDRVAYRHLCLLAKDSSKFPSIKSILHFEGRNGPDAPKLKNKQRVEPPWHFIKPFDKNDTDLIDTIDDHYQQLVAALKSRNQERSAFEAAWLAHALVDGLTPAHHYPYEEALERLRGEHRTSRKTILGHLIVKGESGMQSLARSMKLIGPKGLLTTHTMFEAGLFALLWPLRLKRSRPNPDQLKMVQKIGVSAYFMRLAKEIGALELYEMFYESGWTPHLARLVRRELLPRMALGVTLAWYNAQLDAGITEVKP